MRLFACDIASSAHARAYPELQLQRLDDGFGNLVLQRKDVVQVPVEALGPEVAVGRAVDELRGDAHAVARLAHAP